MITEITTINTIGITVYLGYFFLCDPQIVLNAMPLGHFPWLWRETERHTWENKTVATKYNTSRTSSGKFIPLTHCFLVLTKPSYRSNIKDWELVPLLVSKVLQQH